MGTLLLPIVGLLLGILNAIVFFKKKSSDESSSKLYSRLLIFNIIYTLFGVIVFSSVLFYTGYTLVNIMLKLHMVMTLWMILLLGNYVFIGCKFSDKIEKISLIVLSVIGGCFSLLTLVSPHNVSTIDGLIYGNSFAYNVVLTCMVGFLLFDTVIAIYNLIKNKNLEYVSSFIVLCLLFGIGLILRGMFFEIIFENFVISFVLLIMYLTIENPYLKEIDRLEENISNVVDSNDDKSAYLANMSKEIRMPLNSIVGLTEDIFSYEGKLPEEVVEDINDISKASQSLLEIVDNVLEYNDIENDEEIVVEDAYNFVDEVGTLLREFDMNNKKDNVNFTFNIADDIPYELLGNIKLIKEVISSFLKSLYENRNVRNINFTVKVANDNTFSVLSIQIQVRGIKSFELDLENNVSLIEKMNGKFKVHDLEDGLLIFIQLQQKISSISNFIKESEENKNLVKEHRRILIVDDNSLNIKVASKALVDFGFEIDSCETGEECLDKIQSGYIYDLILLDIMMPEMNGEEVFDKLKAIEGFNIPVMALTADAEIGAKAKYVSLGFIDYIAKPFSREQIKSRLDLIFGDLDDFSDLKTNNETIEKMEEDVEEIETL